LRLTDLAAYLRALGLDLCLVFGQQDSTIVNKIKYHAVAIKRLLAELVKLAQMDAQIAQGVAGFHGEAFFNLIQILRDSVKDLPRREDGTAFVDIEIETAQAVTGHLAEPDEISPITGLDEAVQPDANRTRSTPSRIRTCDLRIRSPLLYPAELWAQFFYL
jgi:hypothetical protein